MGTRRQFSREFRFETVKGAGAAGMKLTDALLTHCDVGVTLIDRRHAPGDIGSMASNVRLRPQADLLSRSSARKVGFTSNG